METLTYDGVTLEIDGSVATMTLNDPGTLNALTMEMAESLIRAFDELGKPERNIRATLLTGAGRGFCAGLNIRRARGTKNELPITNMERLFVPLMTRLREAPFPIVAAVNGPCAGIGVTIAIMSDTVVAARSAYLLLPFIENLALLGDAGITWILTRLIGWARARRMFLFGERVTAETALEWGLIDEVCDDDDIAARGRAIAEQLASGPTMAMAQMRKALWEGLQQDYDRHLKSEVDLNQPLYKTDDHKEALRAFRDKRKPNYTGY